MKRSLVAVAALAALLAPLGALSPAAAAEPDDRGICLMVDDPSTPWYDRLCVFQY